MLFPQAFFSAGFFRQTPRSACPVFGFELLFEPLCVWGLFVPPVPFPVVRAASPPSSSPPL